MVAVGLSGVVLCRVLLRARLVPRFVAIWGLLGYALLGLGAGLEVLGVGVGLLLSVPGGLFELALGVLLIARGFPMARSRRHGGPAGDGRDGAGPMSGVPRSARPRGGGRRSRPRAPGR